MRKKMRRNRKPMLTDRPDVPPTLWAVESPKWVFWRQPRERTYNLNDNVSTRYSSTLINKNNILLRLDVTFNR